MSAIVNTVIARRESLNVELEDMQAGRSLHEKKLQRLNEEIGRRETELAEIDAWLDLNKADTHKELTV